jgi:CHAD domain-containing protein
MFISTERTAASAVAILAPFLPFLLHTRKSRSQNLADVIDEYGGQEAWDMAQTLWQTFKCNLDDEDMEEVEGLALGLAARPSDQERRTTFIVMLVPLLKEEPQLTREIFRQLSN